MAPSTPDRHTFLPSASPNKCAKCARGKGSPYHINPATTFSWTPLTFTVPPTTQPMPPTAPADKGKQVQRIPSPDPSLPSVDFAPPPMASTYADRAKAKTRTATTFSWTPPTFTPPSPPAPDVFSDVPDDPDYTSDLDSDASDDEGVPAHILAEFEETTRILDDLREYADQAFKALPNPAFTHPLRYAMHLMKVGFTHLRAPPEPAPSSPPPSSPPFCADCDKKETEKDILQGYLNYTVKQIPPARVLADTSTQTAPPPPPPPARVLMDAAAQTPRPQHAECGTQATLAPPPTPPQIPPARVLADASTQTAPPPPPPPARVLMDAAAQTSRPQHAECGTQATLAPPPTPPARVLSDAATFTPVRTVPAPAPSPPPTPARTPTRSTSPPPRSPSTHEDFNKVLARLTALRKEVSPPPSPPPTPRTASPAPRAASEAAHLHLTIAVPHGIHSLTLDLVEHVPVPANNLYGEFSAHPATANARAHRGWSRGRPVASPVRRRQHSS
ncbi:hypothetical protein V8D89_002144 [Ganoderma adspersum]